jgi:bifunctional non-homologous end joining protein LigD
LSVADRRSPEREIKFDGCRTHMHLRDGRAILYSRNGHNWTWRGATLANALLQLSARQAVLDA